MCIKCHTRVARRIKKNGEWWYYPEKTCQHCRDKEALKKELETAGEVNEAEKIYTPRDVTHISTFIIAHLNEVPTDNNEWRKEFEIIISWINHKLKGE